MRSMIYGLFIALIFFGGCKDAAACDGGVISFAQPVYAQPFVQQFVQPAYVQPRVVAQPVVVRQRVVVRRGLFAPRVRIRAPFVRIGF